MIMIGIKLNKNDMNQQDENNTSNNKSQIMKNKSTSKGTKENIKMEVNTNGKKKRNSQVTTKGLQRMRITGNKKKNNPIQSNDQKFRTTKQPHYPQKYNSPNSIN